MKIVRFCSLILLFFIGILPVRAHVGSKDIFEQTNAGPYKLFITIRPPNVIPGVASVEVRSTSGSVSTISITSMPMTGEASKHPPTPDALKVSALDPAFFTGDVWLMELGSWMVSFDVHGSSGRYVVRVPVPAAELSTVRMTLGLALLLTFLVCLLACGSVSIIMAAVSQATMPHTSQPSRRRSTSGWIAGGLTIVVLALIAVEVAKSWSMEASDFSAAIYHPPVMYPALNESSLRLLLDEPNNHHSNTWYFKGDFIPDHGKMMHLYAIRMPQMDAVFHLHPKLNGREFDLDLPAMPQGEYTLYGDVVHADGFPETLLAKLDIPANRSNAELQSDDAQGFPSALSRGLLGQSYPLPDHYTMVWDAPKSLLSRTSYALHFRLLDTEGRNATDMQPYLGMVGHAAIVKTDGSVFAHVHPEGSAAMAAMMLANDAPSMGMADAGQMSGMDMNNGGRMSGMQWDTTANSVDFPFGFPSSGHYRIFVQMKHGSVIETGTFDAVVH